MVTSDNESKEIISKQNQQAGDCNGTLMHTPPTPGQLTTIKEKINQL